MLNEAWKKQRGCKWQLSEKVKKNMSAGHRVHGQEQKATHVVKALICLNFLQDTFSKQIPTVCFVTYYFCTTKIVTATAQNQDGKSKHVF